MKQWAWMLGAVLSMAPVEAGWWETVASAFTENEEQEAQEEQISDDDKLQILTAALQSPTLAQRLRMTLTIERGNLYLDMGSFQEALNDFNSVLARKPEDQDILLEALAGQAKALLALGKTDQFLATRSIIINIEPPEGYPVESDYYYLMTFPDQYGGANWWRNPLWRTNFHTWLHQHPHQVQNVVFTNRKVEVLQKPTIKTTPVKPINRPPSRPETMPIKPEVIEREKPDLRTRIDWDAVDEDRRLEAPRVERPQQVQRPAPMQRPSGDRFNPLNR